MRAAQSCTAHGPPGGARNTHMRRQGRGHANSGERRMQGLPLTPQGHPPLAGKDKTANFAAAATRERQGKQKSTPRGAQEERGRSPPKNRKTQTRAQEKPEDRTQNQNKTRKCIMEAPTASHARPQANRKGHALPPKGRPEWALSYHHQATKAPSKLYKAKERKKENRKNNGPARTQGLYNRAKGRSKRRRGANQNETRQ